MNGVHFETRRFALTSTASLTLVPLALGLLISSTAAAVGAVALAPALSYGAYVLRLHRREEERVAVVIQELESLGVPVPDGARRGTILNRTLAKVLAVARYQHNQVAQIAARRALLGHEFYGASTRRFHSESRLLRGLVSDLHDSLAQDIVAIRWSLTGDDADPRSEVNDAITHAEVGLRSFLNKTRPADGPADVYIAALEMVALLRRRYNLSVDLKWPNRPWLMTDVAATVVMHFLQESLHNVIKHSGRLQATVTVTASTEDGLCVTVRDFGNYRAASRKAPEQGHHIGLQGLTERARAAGGDAVLQEAEGGGALAILNLDSEHIRLAESPA